MDFDAKEIVSLYKKTASIEIEKESQIEETSIITL